MTNDGPKSGGGAGQKSLYERWKEDIHNQSSYDDEDLDICGLTSAQMAYANAHDIHLRGQIIQVSFFVMHKYGISFLCQVVGFKLCRCFRCPRLG